MYIFARQVVKLEAGQAVNMIAKHLKKNLGGAYKMTKSPNMCDVYFLLYYQVPNEDPLYEMHIDLNITTYQNKVRVNLIEITPEERTLGFDLYNPGLIQDNIIEARGRIWNKVVQRLQKAYSEYDFVF